MPAPPNDNTGPVMWDTNGEATPLDTGSLDRGSCFTREINNQGIIIGRCADGGLNTPVYWDLNLNFKEFDVSGLVDYDYELRGFAQGINNQGVVAAQLQFREVTDAQVRQVDDLAVLFTPKTANLDAIADALISEAASCAIDGSLMDGEVRAIEASLDAIFMQLDRNYRGAACNISGALVNKIEAKMKANRCPSNQSAALLDGALSLQESVCGQ